jgi:hypothetical protein
MSDAMPYGFNPATIFDQPDEQLTGEVQGKKASDLEERWYRAARKYWDGWIIFRQRLSPLAAGGYLEDYFFNLPGELEVDFLIGRGFISTEDGGLQGQFVQPISIKGQIGHFFSSWQADVDASKEAQINKIGQGMGWQPIVSVPQNRHDLYKLSSQNLADQTFRAVMGV